MTPTSTRTETVHFRVHMKPSLHRSISERAKAAGVSMSQWVKDAIAARLEREG